MKRHDESAEVIGAVDGNSISVGCTGGPGQAGNELTHDNPTPGLTLVTTKSTSVADLHDRIRNERIVMFKGLTGAPGQAGDIMVNEQGELTAPVTVEAEVKLNKSLLDKIETMDLDELAAVVIENNQAIDQAIASVDASNGNRGYTSGKALLRAEYLTSSRNLKKGFDSWHKANLNRHRISLRTCQKHMDIARTPGVLNWLVLGIEKLSALKPILNKHDDLDPQDPIKDFMERFGINPKEHTDVEDLRFEIGVGIAMARLKESGVKVPKELVHDFMAAGFDMKVSDVDIMKDLQGSKGEPASYLKKLIENGERPKVTKAKGVTVDNIHEQAQLLVDSIGKLLKSPSIAGKVEVDRINVLIERLEDLKARIQAPAGN